MLSYVVYLFYIEWYDSQVLIKFGEKEANNILYWTLCSLEHLNK